jgi:hypothetical protein
MEELLQSYGFASVVQPFDGGNLIVVECELSDQYRYCILEFQA